MRIGLVKNGSLLKINHLTLGNIKEYRFNKSKDYFKLRFLSNSYEY